MNTARRLAAAVQSPHKWEFLRPAGGGAATFRSSPLSSSAAAAPVKRATRRSAKAPEPEKPAVPPPPLEPSKVPRPSEIPFQSRVANSIHLVGTVGVPVQLQTSPDGAYSAVSVLVHERTKEFPQFWIPVIFQGDLAQIAACHLKEDDLVYISGQLSGDGPPLTMKDVRTSIQVLAHGLSFVESNSPKHAANKEHLCNDVANSHKLGANLARKSDPSSAAFVHKDSGQLPLINESTSNQVPPKVGTLSFGESIPKKSHRSGNVKDGNLWSDLVANPQEWRDNRINKLNGSVKPKYPDFSHIVSKEGLWLNSVPDWVLPKLDDIVFGGSSNLNARGKDHDALSAQDNRKGEYYISKSPYKTKEGNLPAVPSKKRNEPMWKDLVENPKKWWDNRLDKRNPRAPDFKHKDSGEGLWLSNSPSWVLPKLPPTTENSAESSKKATLLS